MADLTERIYDEHADALFAFLLQLSRHEADTKDLLQELFLKIEREPQKFSFRLNLRSFLFRVAHNLFLDSCRRRGSRQRVAESLGVLGYQELFDSPPHAESDIDSQRVAEALGLLPPDQRAVVHLKIWGEQTFAEIAQILDLSPNTVASRYRYALDKLTELLRSYYKELHE